MKNTKALMNNSLTVSLSWLIFELRAASFSFVNFKNTKSYKVFINGCKEQLSFIDKSLKDTSNWYPIEIYNNYLKLFQKEMKTIELNGLPAELQNFYSITTCLFNDWKNSIELK